MQTLTESGPTIFGTDPMPVMLDGVSSHIFEDRLLIFSEEQQKLYALNDSAAFIWLCQENRLSLHELVATLMNTYGIEKKQAHADVTNTFAEWAATGLVRIGSSEKQAADANEINPDTGADPSDVRPAPQIGECHCFRLSLAGSDFLIRVASAEITHSLSEVFAHLESKSNGPARMVDIVESDGRFSIYAPGVPVVENVEPQHVIPVVTQTVLRSAYKNCSFLIAVHAAVLSMNGRCVIFPGQSGNGKTTLTAALIKNGFTYFTDEVALLDRGTQSVIPVPVSLRVKESGWDIVGHMFPDLDRVPWHFLSDGQKLRYLPPPAGSSAQDPIDRCPARWLVFPRYSPGSETAISPISRIEAISRLQSTGYDIGGHFDRTKIIEILSWLKTVDCYEMHVNQLDDAARIIQSLVDGNRDSRT